MLNNISTSPYEETIIWSDPREPEILHSTIVMHEPHQERFVPKLRNPRLSYCLGSQVTRKRKAKQKAPNARRSGLIELYHFTSIVNLQSILASGLTYGTVASGHDWHDYFNNATWFTEAANGSMQCEDELSSPTSKNRICLKVEMDLQDGNIWRWSDLAHHLKLPLKLYTALNRGGGNTAHLWWVYTNHSVPASHIIQVIDMKDGADITETVLKVAPSGSDSEPSAISN
jgi:hypothetical protein